MKHVLSTIAIGLALGTQAFASTASGGGDPELASFQCGSKCDVVFPELHGSIDKVTIDSKEWSVFARSAGKNYGPNARKHNQNHLCVFHDAGSSSLVVHGVLFENRRGKVLQHAFEIVPNVSDNEESLDPASVCRTQNDG